MGVALCQIDRVVKHAAPEGSVMSRRQGVRVGGVLTRRFEAPGADDDWTVVAADSR